MKITVCFEANSMAHLKDQLLEAFGSISTGGEVVFSSNTPLTDKVIQESAKELLKQTFETEKSFEEKEAERSPVAVFGEVPQRIDGHVVSEGNVWVKQPDKSNAFSPVPVETYMETKKDVEEPKKKRTRAKKDVVQSQPEQEPAAFVAPAFPVASEPANAAFIKPAAQVAPVTESNAPAIGMAPDMYTYESFKNNLSLATVKLHNQKKLSTEDIQALCAHFKVAQLWDLKDNDANCRILFDHFIKHGLITGV